MEAGADYEWDEVKAKTNFHKHGVSFGAIYNADWNEALEFDEWIEIYRAPSSWAVDHTPVGEWRTFSLVPIDGRLHAAVYTVRDEKCRLISLRLATRNERLQYERTS